MVSVVSVVSVSPFLSSRMLEDVCHCMGKLCWRGEISTLQLGFVFFFCWPVYNNNNSIINSNNNGAVGVSLVVADVKNSCKLTVAEFWCQYPPNLYSFGRQ